MTGIRADVGTMRDIEVCFSVNECPEGAENGSEESGNVNEQVPRFIFCK